MLRPADFDTEKIRVIKHWKDKVINPTYDSNNINRAYLIASIIVCELCVKDVYEQVVPLFSQLKNEDTRNFLASLQNTHDIVFISKQLSNLTDGEYTFPPLCEDLDGRETENILYNEVNLNVDKDDILMSVERYLKCHDDFLEDYNEKYYKLKSQMNE